jgi:hypothetical protein
MMIAYPRCPYIRVGLTELASLLSGVVHQLKATVFFEREQEFHEDWVKSDLSKEANTIPHVRSIIDDRREADLLGALTSGQTPVYERHGYRVLSGGITIARGHIGENGGLLAITRVVNNSPLVHEEDAPVYRYPLFAEGKRFGETACKQ